MKLTEGYNMPISPEQAVDLEQSRTFYDTMAHTSKQVLGRAALILGFAAIPSAALTAANMASDKIASAEAEVTDTYPDKNAAPYNVAAYEWWVDENNNGVADVTPAAFDNDEAMSSRGYYYKNCTDWASFRATQLTGLGVPSNLGNATTWDNNSPSSWIVDTTPEAGDIAQNDTLAYNYGHVGIVEEVNKNQQGQITSIKVSEYNTGTPGTYSYNTYIPNAAGNFSNNWHHFLDLNGTGVGIPGQGSGNNNPARPVAGDYNGDGITDAAVYRPNDGYWHVRGVGDYQWGGWAGDIPVPADYNGDGKTDIAIYRPSNGGWYIRNVGVYAYGWNGDIPVPGDYNGDGSADMAVYRPSEGGVWHVRGVGDYQWGGWAGDIPVPGYYNNDNNLDIAIYRPSNGGWYIRNVGDFPYGWSEDIPVQADYNGDGITDMAVYRPSEGGWHVRGVGDFPHGWSTDIPVPGRYNNDGYTDAAIYRPDDGGWRIRAVGDFPYGFSTDIPAISTLNAKLLKQYVLIPGY